MKTNNMYCPVCGEKGTVERIDENRGECNKCFSIIAMSSLLANVKQAYPVWLKYNHDVANGIRKKRRK